LFAVGAAREAADPTLTEFADLADRVLALAERQGFPRCPLTLVELGVAQRKPPGFREQFGR
jgi:hypothetical protein